MHALRVLEFQAIRERLQYHCETPIAAALALELVPSFEWNEVWERLEFTSEAYDALGKHSPPALGSIRDPREGLMLAEKGSSLSGQDLFQIAECMGTMRSLKVFLASRSEDLPNLAKFAPSLPDHQKLEQQLRDGLESDGTVRDSASAALATLRSRKRSALIRIQERIQSYISGRSRELLSDPIFTVRDGRYVLPLKAENRGKIRGIVHDTSSSGQTLFVEPEDVLQLGNALREIEASERVEVQRVLTAWSAKIGAIGADLCGGVEAASSVDFHFAKARLAYGMKATAPTRSRSPFSIKIHGGKHPLLDPSVVVPLDIEVGKGTNVLITGPNTGGKTVAIKCVGLFVLMAQAGLMLPALDVQLSPFSQVWADIGDEQSLEQSLSTFSGHLKNIAEAMNKLHDGALVLFDEIGAGTDPAEGAALAKSILTSLVEGGAAILASTHYGELKAYAYNQPGFTNAAMEFDQKTLRPTYRLLLGSPGASQALRIAERYGISKEVVEKARESLGEEAQDMALMLERLENAQRQARTAQSEADRRTADLKKAEARAARKLSEADEIRQNAHTKANEIIEAALREIRLEASRLFDELKKSPTDAKAIERARKGLRELDEVGRDFASAFAPKIERTGAAPELSKGNTVSIRGLTQSAIVLDNPKNGMVSVQAGRMKMMVPVDRLEISADKPLIAEKPRVNLSLQKAISATTEIDLRHLRAEEAVRELERFVDDAVLAGLPSIRIIHGKGEGVLRKATQDLLRTHGSVAKYRDGEPSEGGQGATVAELA